MNTTPPDLAARYRDFTFLAADCLWETDAEGRFTYLSAPEFLGHAASAVLGKRPHELGLLTSDTLASPFQTREARQNVEFALAGRALFISALPIKSHENEFVGTRGVCRDVTEVQIRDRALATARTRERIVSHIVNILRDDLSPERELLAAAKSLTLTLAALGCVIYRHDGHKWDMIAHYGDGLPSTMTVLSNAIMKRGDVVQFTSGGVEWLVSRTQVHRQMNGAIAVWRTPDERNWGQDEQRLMAAVADQVGMIWAQLSRTAALTALAERDPLTGLYNQRTFTEQVQARLEHGQGGAALVALDLNNFKLVNDHLGHPEGDAVLKRIAEVIRTAIRGGDIAARVGGDEFMLWLERVNEAEADIVTSRVAEGIASIAEGLPPLPRPLGVAIGIAHATENKDFSGLLRAADENMYAHKRQAKS